jgi:hypothetical protein
MPDGIGDGRSCRKLQLCPPRARALAQTREEEDSDSNLIHSLEYIVRKLTSTVVPAVGHVDGRQL